MEPPESPDAPMLSSVPSPGKAGPPPGGTQASAGGDAPSRSASLSGGQLAASGPMRREAPLGAGGGPVERRTRGSNSLPCTTPDIHDGEAGGASDPERSRPPWPVPGERCEFGAVRGRRRPRDRRGEAAPRCGSLGRRWEIERRLRKDGGPAAPLGLCGLPCAGDPLRSRRWHLVASRPGTKMPWRCARRTSSARHRVGAASRSCAAGRWARERRSVTRGSGNGLRARSSRGNAPPGTPTASPPPRRASSRRSSSPPGKRARDCARHCVRRGPSLAPPLAGRIAAG